jgi:hypothetical protein
MRSIFDLVFHGGENEPFPTECAMRLASMVSDGSIKTRKLEAMSCLLSIAGWFVNSWITNPDSPLIGKAMEMLDLIGDESVESVAESTSVIGSSLSRDKQILAKLESMEESQ